MSRKQILCYGDSNTWGYDGATRGRFDAHTRWPMQLQQLLGPNYLIQEAGLCGRTSVFEDPLSEGLNGLTTLLPTLQTHAPLDLMVLMLGTNDCKERFSATPGNITDGLARLVLKARQADVWADRPRILLVAPILIDPRVHQHPNHGPHMGQGCVEKSRALPPLIERMAREQGCHYLDCNLHVTAAEGDFMHFDEEGCTRFAKALAQLIPELLA